MGTFTVGQVVVLPFPFSDLSQKKLRPALLLAEAGRGDYDLFFPVIDLYRNQIEHHTSLEAVA